MGTENSPPKEMWLDNMTTFQSISTQLENQLGAFHAVKNSINQITQATDQIYNKLNDHKDSKLIYVGAGTSIRIGVQDCAELHPTFGWPYSRSGYIVAGGDKAILKSIEGAEDNIEEIEKILEDKNITSSDIVIGIAASGNTPFTLETICLAKKRGALTIGVVNNKNTKIEENADITIILDTGFEVVAGSTRLKAGTAQKICLNLISTSIMSKLGKVKMGQMTHFIASNKKLLKRKNRVLNFINKNNHDL